MSPVTTLRAAAASIADGALLTFGGFQLNRAPMALVFELVRQHRRELRVVSLPNPIPLDLLVAAGAVVEAEFGFIGFQFEDGFVVAPNVRRAVERGTIFWRERDVYEIVQALRAAALGVPFLPAPGGEGSDYRRVNGTPSLDDGTGEGTLIARPVRPDVALLHAQEADRQGNLLVTDPYAEDLLARASGRVVATAERIVERIDRPTIPHTLVDAVAEAPGGAFPTSCHRHYPYSAAHLRPYVTLASEERTAEYIERHVTGTPDLSAFLTAAGGPGTWTAAPPPPPREAEIEDALHGILPIDRLVTALARAIADQDVVTTGVASALPMLAVALARATHAPGLTYINCVGAINPRLTAASPSSVDVRLLDNCAATLTLPELFDRARLGGIDLMFFGAAQVDREGRTNLTCIGDYARPTVKLPGPAGSSSMRPFIPKVVIALPRHSPRALVARVDFATSVASPRNRVTTVVTDRAILDLRDGTLRLVSRHAGISMEDLRARTGFPLDGAAALTPEPTEAEMAALRRLDPLRLRDRMIA